MKMNQMTQKQMAKFCILFDVVIMNFTNYINILLMNKRRKIRKFFK